MFDLLPEKPAIETNSVTVLQLVDGASDAAFAIDDHHRVVVWNNAAEQLLGYSAGEVIGQRCGEILQSVLPGGEPHGTEKTLIDSEPGMEPLKL